MSCKSSAVLLESTVENNALFVVGKKLLHFVWDLLGFPVSTSQWFFFLYPTQSVSSGSHEPCFEDRVTEEYWRIELWTVEVLYSTVPLANIDPFMGGQPEHIPDIFRRHAKISNVLSPMLVSKTIGKFGTHVQEWNHSERHCCYLEWASRFGGLDIVQALFGSLELHRQQLV
jgi:hypothetical protein